MVETLWDAITRRATDFIEGGQERRQWLDDLGRRAEYYVPPELRDRIGLLGKALEFTDAGDMTAAADASRNLWNNPSIETAADYAAASAALALPFYSNKMAEGFQDLVKEGAAAYDPSMVRIFAGANAKSADLDALKKARELSARRRSPREIWDATGWFKGADGQWRFEIDDSKAVLRQKAADALNYGGPEYQTNYSGGLLHQQLLGGNYRGENLPAAYPDMFGDMNFSQRPRQSGSFDLDTGQIRVSSPDASEGLPVALHELQHAVQAQEGFAPGSNPGFELNELLNDRLNETRRISNEIERKQAELGLPGYQPKHPELDPLYEEYNRAVNRAISDEEAYQQYIRTAGEVEANNVMKRQRMTAEQRRATPPWETQDFPYEEQIVRTRDARRGLLY